MVLCVVVGCSSKSGNRKGFGFFRIPKIITNQGEEQEELTIRRRNEWISAASRGDSPNKRVLESERLCSKHFALKLPEQSGFGRQIGQQKDPLNLKLLL